ncbi:uncharacterized protein LOC102706455 isoform X2 [Oryza brachyantha]|uniref:uncharacterized protein LOC102706455 isoform X2 n=1 Tax=Oryza brachyantha TaxID=4533 RepID=UPI001AD9DCFB|nr:uncharacterized protein LOC102706455 isoform X2 [Oryza brachyantha]
MHQLIPLLCVGRSLLLNFSRYCLKMLALFSGPVRATDVVVLKFMVEVCWAPMLAAFSVPLDQSDDEIVISQCLKGFRSAIHVTAAMSMKTQRDAFVTSLAKFTSLHSAADIKQKNVEAIKYTRRYPTNMPCFPIKQARKHRQKEACDTDTNSVLKDAFLTRISGGDDVNRDAQSVPCMIDAKCLTQFFVNVCGNRVSMQEDLNSLTVKQLTKTVCKKAGIQAYDFYAVHGGKSLKDDKTVSCYPIYRDSTVFLRYRLRAGCPRMISFKICTFDEMIKSHEGGLFRRVNLSHRSRSSITNENEVTFLSYFAQYIAHQVLVYVCGKHRKGLSFDGKFESTDIFFCSGRVRFTEHVERVGFTEITCRADYKKLMQIFGKCFTIKTENNMEFILCMFLSCLST